MNTKTSSNLKRLAVSTLAVSVLALLSACTSEKAGEPATPDAATTAATTEATPPPAPVQPAPVAAAFAIPAELQVAPAESGGECGIEATESVPQCAQLTLSRAHGEYLEGWALVRDNAVKAEKVFIKLASTGEAYYFAPVSVVTRPGLGIRLQDATRDDAGFNVTLDLKDVPAGKYTIQVAQRVGDMVLLCDTGRAAEITE